MISLDFAGVNLTPLYEKINEVNLKVLDLDETMGHVLDSITEISSQLGGGGFNEFDFQNTNNISGIASGLNGYSDTIYNFNCINCSAINDNFNSYTNVSGSLHGNGLSFSNCFNNYDSKCDLQLNVDKMENCMKNCSISNLDVNCNKLSDCYNTCSPMNFNFNISSMTSCFINNTFSAASTGFINALSLQSVFNSCAFNTQVALNVNCSNCVNLFNSNTISFIDGYFNGNVGSYCFNNMILDSTSIHTSSGLRTLHFNIKSMNSCINNATCYGGFNIKCNADDLYYCMNSWSLTKMNVSNSLFSLYVNGANANSILNNLSLYYSGIIALNFNSCLNALNKLSNSESQIVISINGHKYSNIFLTITNALLLVNFNVEELRRCFYYLTMTHNYSYISLLGNINSFNDAFYGYNDIRALNLKLEGVFMSNVMDMASSQTSNLIQNVYPSLNYVFMSQCFNGLWNKRMSTLSHDISKGVVCQGQINCNNMFGCFNSNGFISDTIDVICNTMAQCFNRNSQSSMYAYVNNATACFTSNTISYLNGYFGICSYCFSGYSGYRANIDCKSMYGAFVKNTIDTCIMNCDVFSNGFTSNTISSMIANINYLYECGKSNSFNYLLMDAKCIMGALAKNTINTLLLNAGIIINGMLSSNSIQSIILKGDDLYLNSDAFKSNTISTLIFKDKMTFGSSAFTGNNIVKALTFSKPPVFAGVSVWKDNVYGSALTLEIPNVFYVGTGRSSIGIKVSDNVPEFVWQPDGVISNMQQYCSNYTSLISDVCTNTNKKLILNNYIQL